MASQKRNCQRHLKKA
uniref:Uncharacterized protein n=1 Tax=Rhizophora mucronata TaxID=61149 RepID=A0A2P2NWT8_RHIMU